MRIGGLATGMDIDQMVDKLMDAERIPYNKLKQDQTKLTWKQDAFRDVNKALLELDNKMLDMKLSRTYNAKNVSSTQENAVTGIPSSESRSGTYQFEVEKLATQAINVGEKVEQKIDEKYVGEHSFVTYDEDGEKVTHEFTVEEDDTVNDVLERISKDDSPVRAFYDQATKKVILETTRTGKYNDNGQEIEFGKSSIEFFEKALGLTEENAIDATDASFIYNNGAQMTSKNNSYELDGTLFEFHSETNGSARLSVSTDEDAVFDSITDFINTYNDVVETINATQQEERFRDFPPLTDEEKNDMSEDEIKKWEEKAQSGILRGESILSNGLFNMRNSWYGSVENEGKFNSITEIGISTSKKYLDGGKLEIDEDLLRKAIAEDPENVQNLFSNSSDGNERGIINRLDDKVDQISKQINDRAGKATSTLDNFSLGKRMKEVNKRISDFEVRLENIETRYWNQFTQMEKAIQRMNDQSAQLFSQFGDM